MGVVLKKKWGRLQQDLDKDLQLHRILIIKIILHCVSVINQLQQWTNFCTNFSPKRGGVGDASPLSKKVGGRRPTASPPHYTAVYKSYPDPARSVNHKAYAGYGLVFTIN